MWRFEARRRRFRQSDDAIQQGAMVMSDAQVRRRPQQERSKSRVETILDVALEMIIEAGSEDLAMREVARRA